MPTVIVPATTVGGLISNISGLYNASDEGIYDSHVSSSSAAEETEAHVWFDTSDAATGLAGIPWTGLTASLNITTYNNPGEGSWNNFVGTDAGATFDLSDWRKSSLGYVLLFPQSTGLYIYAIPSDGWIRSNIFHMRITAQGYDPAETLIKFSYTPRPFLTISYSLGRQRTLMGVGL